MVRRPRRHPARPAGRRPRCGAPLLPHPGGVGRAGRGRGGPVAHLDAPWPEFPFHSSRLNALVLHDHVVDLAEGFLGTADLACYMGIVTAKYAHQASGYNQLLHADYPNHMLVVPRARGGVPAGGVLRLPDRRDHGGRREPVRLVAEDQGHPRRTAHPELRGLRRALRRPIGRGGAGRLCRRLPARRLPPLGRTSRPLTLPGHAPRLLPPSRRRLGRLSGLALPGFSSSSASTSNRRPLASSPCSVCRRPGIPTGTRRPWPACRLATPGWTCPPGGTRGVADSR